MSSGGVREKAGRNFNVSSAELCPGRVLVARRIAAQAWVPGVDRSWLGGQVPKRRDSLGVGLREDSSIEHDDVCCHPVMDVASQRDNSGTVKLNRRGDSPI